MFFQKKIFCFFPFIELNCQSDGLYSPCCRFRGRITHHGKDLRALSDSLKVAWTADSLNRLRQQFVNNERPKECSYCWALEDMGVDPGITEQNSFFEKKYAISQEILVKQWQQGELHPLQLQLRMSNKCNLKCRICGPSGSSLWLQETGVNKKPESYYTTENLLSIKNWLPSLRSVALLGGEPLVFDGNTELLRTIVASGYNKKISLEISTNGTIFSKEICRLYPKFNSARLIFSIDDLGERFNYQRKNADFKTVWSNIKKYQKEFDKTSSVQLSICITVSILNIYYLPQLAEAIYEEFPMFEVWFNIFHESHGVEELSIWNMNDYVKAKLQERLCGIPEHIQNHLKAQGANLKTLVSFMNGRKMETAHMSFVAGVRKTDMLRKESFEKTFPAFWALLTEQP